ncbi:hypothetical protein BJ742DRAFT_737550 [Cladochytrium replicatum]|nr:hypothetical protein BJ742DRAFT_737550 [Cladochytrium replicatum]
MYDTAVLCFPQIPHLSSLVYCLHNNSVVNSRMAQRGPPRQGPTFTRTFNSVSMVIASTATTSQTDPVQINNFIWHTRHSNAHAFPSININPDDYQAPDPGHIIKKEAQDNVTQDQHYGLVSTTAEDTKGWYLNSRATAYIRNKCSAFADIEQLSELALVLIGNNIEAKFQAPFSNKLPSKMTFIAQRHASGLWIGVGDTGQSTTMEPADNSHSWLPQTKIPLDSGTHDVRTLITGNYNNLDKSLQGTRQRAAIPLGLLHIDPSGSIPMPSLYSKIYTWGITDDNSSHKWTLFSARKMAVAFLKISASSNSKSKRNLKPSVTLWPPGAS